MMGIVVFLTIANFDNQYWKSGYYIWDKTKDTLFITSLYGLLPKYRKAIRWVLMYSITRLLWEPVSIITGISVNSSAVVKALFIAWAGAISALLLNDLRQWQKEK